MERERGRQLARERAAAAAALPAFWFPYPLVGAGYPAPRLSPPTSGPPPFPINGVRSPESYFR